MSIKKVRSIYSKGSVAARLLPVNLREINLIQFQKSAGSLSLTRFPIPYPWFDPNIPHSRTTEHIEFSIPGKLYIGLGHVLSVFFLNQRDPLLLYACSLTISPPIIDAT